MSIRGLMGMRKNGKYFGYYNHSDSYPEGLGDLIVSFLKGLTSSDLNTFSKNVEKMKTYDSSTSPSQYLKEKYKKFADISVGSQSIDDWYCLLRSVQGSDALAYILSGELRHVDKDGMGFIKDSLFCEYAYIINLDKGTLELYRGFQKEPQENNPFGTDTSDSYYPCKFIQSFPIDAIPDDWIKVAFPSEDEDIEEEDEEFSALLEEVKPYLQEKRFRKTMLTEIANSM